MTSERRTAMRHLACVLAQVSRGQGSPRSALIRDISTSGAMLLTRASFEVGEKVRLSLFITGDPSKPIDVVGTIRRAGPRPNKMADVWPRSAAVQFESKLTHLSKQLADIAAQQAKNFGEE
jgi:hypothetical protein